MGSDSVHAGLPPNRSQTRGLVYGWVRFGAGGVIPKSATDGGAESRTGKGRAPPAGRTQQHYDVFSYNYIVLSFHLVSPGVNFLEAFGDRGCCCSESMDFGLMCNSHSGNAFRQVGYAFVFLFCLGHRHSGNAFQPAVTP